MVEEDDAEDGDAGDNGAVTLSPKSFRKLIRVISPNQSLFTASPVSSRNFTPPPPTTLQIRVYYAIITVMIATSWPQEVIEIHPERRSSFLF